MTAAHHATVGSSGSTCLRYPDPDPHGLPILFATYLKFLRSSVYKQGQTWTRATPTSSTCRRTRMGTVA